MPMKSRGKKDGVSSDDSMSIRDMLAGFERTAIASLRESDRGHTAHLGPIPLPFRVGAHDGKLNAEEIVALARDLGKDMPKGSEKYLREVMGRGQVTYEQIARKQAISLKGVLDQIDANADGQIKAEELERFAELLRGSSGKQLDPRSLESRTHTPMVVSKQ